MGNRTKDGVWRTGLVITLRWRVTEDGKCRAKTGKGAAAVLATPTWKVSCRLAKYSVDCIHLALKIGQSLKSRFSFKWLNRFRGETLRGCVDVQAVVKCAVAFQDVGRGLKN